MRTTADIVALLMNLVEEIAIEQGTRELSGTDWSKNMVNRIETLRRGLKYIPEIPHNKRKASKQSTAKALRKQGYSIRQIQKQMGYKSTSSIQRLLK